MDEVELLGAVLVVYGLMWLILATSREARAARRREWERLVTTRPEDASPASDWDAWSDELKGWA